MDGVEVKVVPCFEIADVPPEVRMLAVAGDDIDAFNEVDGRVGTGQVFLEGRLRLIFGDVNEVSQNAGIV